VILANISRHQGAAFIDCAAKNCVTANANPRTAWRFFRQIFSGNFFFISYVFRISRGSGCQFGRRSVRLTVVR